VLTDQVHYRAARAEGNPAVDRRDGLARQIMSGFTPKNSLPRPRQASPRFSPRRRSGNAPFLVQISRALAGIRAAAMHNPTFIKMLENDAAIWPGFSRNGARTLLRLLKLATTTLAREAFGMPRRRERNWEHPHRPIFGFGA